MNALVTHRYASPLARILVLLTALSLLVLAQACSQGPEKGQETAAKDAAGTDSAGGKLILYACPMNDVPPLPTPGKCPVCGMELTPVVMGDTEPGAAARISLSPEQLRLAGVRTAPVEKRYVTATIQLFGKMEYDDAFITDINAPTNGILDKVYIRRTGEYIRTDQKLLDFYSAEFQEIEAEILELAKLVPDAVAAQIGVAPNPALRKSSGPPPDENRVREALGRIAVLRGRLSAFGLTKRDLGQVLRLEQPTGLITVRMPVLTSGVGGVIIENKTVQGAYVNKGTTLARVADPHFIWANFDAYEKDYPWLRIGQVIEFTSPARPGETFASKITNIEPIFDEKSLTYRVGVGYNDYRTLFRPGMSLRATVKATLDREGRPTPYADSLERAPLVIPDSAPLITGSRAVVYVAVRGKPGVFEGREIVLGPKADDTYVVLAGLAAGEQIVVNGAFKIDSERQILAKPSMLQPEGLVRLHDFNYTVPPLPAKTRPEVSEHPQEASPAPDFPPAEIFTTHRPTPLPQGGVAGQPAPPGMKFYLGPAPSQSPPVDTVPGQNLPPSTVPGTRPRSAPMSLPGEGPNAPPKSMTETKPKSAPMSMPGQGPNSAPMDMQGLNNVPAQGQGQMPAPMDMQGHDHAPAPDQNQQPSPKPAGQ